jgi:hypothetical protein
MENNFYFDIYGEEAATPTTQGTPRCIYRRCFSSAVVADRHKPGIDYPN